MPAIRRLCFERLEGGRPSSAALIALPERQMSVARRSYFDTRSFCSEPLIEAKVALIWFDDVRMKNLSGLLAQ
jgi:hypothetical protein